jgi:hypothetical protein
VRIILLGPQRRPTLEGVARSLGLSGPVATITAGWQEREPDDAELSSVLLSAGDGGADSRAANLALYRRWLDVRDRDPEYRAGERELAGVLADLQDVYLLRLDYALQAVYAVQRRSSSPDALSEAVEAVRELDAAHLSQVNGARGEFFARLEPHTRPVIAEHRTEVSAVLADAAALVITGGHVGVLAEVLHLFNVAAALQAGSPVIAWSAGAMALADRIVLFGDRSPRGPGHAEVYGSGLSLLRDVVLLPHARARLLLDDTARMAVLVRRFAPARCVPLEAGTRIDVEDGRWPGGIRTIEAA